MTTVGEALIDISSEGSGEAQSALQGVGGALSSLGGIALGVAAGGIAALSAGMMWATAEAMSAQDATAMLDATVAAVGESTSLTSGQLQEMAGHLQDVTRFSDETAMAAESMLLRFENIGEDVFPQALKAAADLATAMGTDLTAAAQAVGRALDNPAEGIGRLNTQLKLFSKEEMTAIQKMAEMGDVAGAQEMILGRLNDKVGGLAEAMGDTLSGRIEILKNKFSDIGEQIGGPFVSALEQGMTGAESFMDGLARGLPPTIALSGALRQMGLGEVADGFNSIVRELSPLSGPMDEIGAAVMALAPNFEDAFGQIGAAFQTAFATAGPESIANLQIAFSSLADVITMVGPAIASGIGFIGSVLGGALGGALTAVTGLVAALLQLASGDVSGAIETFTSSVSSGFMTFANSVSQAVAGVDFTTVIAQWQNNFSMLGTIVSTIGGKIGETINNTATGVGDALTDIAKGVSNAANSIANTAGQWAAAGQALIAGLVGAIKGGASAVVNAAIAVAVAAVQAVKNALGISSPSRVMMEIGSNLTNTLANALSGGMDTPAMAAGRMGAAVASAASAPIAAAPPANPRAGADNSSSVSNIINVVAHDVQDTIDAINRELGNQGQAPLGASAS